MRSNGNGTSLEHRSLAELEALKAEIDAAVSAKREVARQTCQEMIDLAKSRGFDARDLLTKAGRPIKATASATKKSHKGKKPVKYRDPSDPKRTWSGYGKTPGWLIELTKGGKSKETFLSR